MGLMKRLRTAETNGHPIPEGGNAIIKACRTEQALKAWQAQSGPPEPPQANTGFYLCDGAYHWVGTGPWPDYRPPGLAWGRGWKQPKPKDVPWRDEAKPPEKKPAAPKPYTVDDAWEEVGDAIRALPPADATGHENAFGPQPKTPRRKREKKRADGLTQAMLF